MTQSEQLLCFFLLPRANRYEQETRPIKGGPQYSPAHRDAVTSVASLTPELCVSGGKDKVCEVAPGPSKPGQGRAVVCNSSWGVHRKCFKSPFFCQGYKGTLENVVSTCSKGSREVLEGL